MEGQYFICPVCRKSYTETGKENRKKTVRFCPECGRKLIAVQMRFFVGLSEKRSKHNENCAV